MLVVEGRYEGLLKMKASEFMLGNDKENALRMYKELVIEVDNKLCDELISMIRDTDINNLSLEEQLTVLNEILEGYQYVCEKQSEFKNIYHEGYKLVYAEEEDDLVLRDLSDILIDNIRNRFMAVQGFLINGVNIKKNQVALEKLNQELIVESKRKDDLSRKYSDFEVELKNGFLDAEGRNYDTNGNLVNNTMVDEYKNFDLSLEKLLNNPDLLKQKLNEAKSEKQTLDEELLAVETCYELTPTDDNRDIFATAIQNSARATYKLVLLSMAELVSHEQVDYSLMIRKRKQILALNEERLECLDALGVKVAYDPFKKTRVKEQLENIEKLGNNDADIEVITRNIGNLDRLVHAATKENEQYAIELGRDIILLKEEPIFSEQIVMPKQAADNKVISIADSNPDMDMDRVGEQTGGVIKRACEFFRDDEKPQEEVSPELVIAPVAAEEEDNASKVVFTEDSGPVFPLGEHELVEEGMPALFEDVTQKTDEVFPSHPEVTEERINEQLFENVSQGAEAVFPQEEHASVNNGVLGLATGNQADTGAVTADVRTIGNIFDDHDEPFGEAPLYSDRADIESEEKKAPSMETSSVPQKVSEVEPALEMPEVFWTTGDDGNSGLAPDGGETIDEQVAALGIEPETKSKTLGKRIGG